MLHQYTRRGLRRSSVVAVALTVVTGTLSFAGSWGAASAATSDHTPIVVGATGDPGFGTGVGSGFEAGIYRFNKAGGLDGRKIKFVGVLDDNYTSSLALTNTQKLVEDDHIFASVPLNSVGADAATGAFLAQNKIPFIGYTGNAAFATQTKWGFGVDGNQGVPDVQSLGAMKMLLDATGDAKTPGKVKLALVGEDVPAGLVADDAIAGIAKHLGMKVVYNGIPIPVAGATSYAPYAQNVISLGANLVFESITSSLAVGLAAALKADNFKGVIGNAVTYYPGQLASSPNEAAALNGVYVWESYPANENNTPAVKQAEKDLKAVGAQPYLTSGVSIGYWSAIVFEQMLRATLKKVGGDPSKVTSIALQKTINGGFTYTDPIAGGIGTEYFPAAEKTVTGCGTLLKTTGTTFKQILPYECLGAFNVSTGKKLSLKTGEPIS